MADISMCSGKGCELKETCYRFKAKPNEYRQAYFFNAPKSSPTNCIYYWDRSIE